MSYELYHYGVKGMKWGVRRYQNKDGSLTRLGRKHQAAAVKGLRDSKNDAESQAVIMKAYTKANKDALDRARQLDKKTGETSWETQALSDAHKATGRQYVNAKYHAEIYDAYISAYSSGSIKLGQDYVVKNLKKGIVELSDSGREKEKAIIDRVTEDFDKRYAKEIEEYS